MSSDKPSVVAPTSQGQKHANVLMGTRFWINLVVEDELGSPIPDIRVNFDFADGNKQGRNTDENGKVTLSDLPRVDCDVWLEGQIFFTEKSGAGTLVKTNESDVTFPQKETLSGIAKKHGLHDGRTIYHYPKNAPLRAKRPLIGKVAPGDKMIVPSSYALHLKVKPNDTQHVYRLVVPVMIDLLEVDDHFAPSAEKLDLLYEIHQLSNHRVTLEVTSPHYKGGPVFKTELGPQAKADGTHPLQWSGKANASKGELADRFLNPLFSPYTVKIFATDKHYDDGELKVLYHSIKIAKGPFTPDEKEPDQANEKEWVAFKLNELGYYGGPVGKDTDRYLKKAIIRYKANHKKLHEVTYSKYNDAITDALKTALAANENRRTSVEVAAFGNPAARSKILVEALTYETGELGLSRPAKERERLNRPLVPVEVEILLKSKKDKAVAAPQAVGPVRVNFRFTDTNEDLAPLPANTAAEPSQTKVYVEAALKLKGGRAGKGDNCHKDFGGIRDDAEDWVTPWLLGDFYVPHKAEEDKGQKLVFSRACVDKDKHDKRVGKAGIFFRPSFVAGDDYKLTAEIDFTGLPNKADLEKVHGVTSEATRIRVETGTFQVRRFNKIAMVIGWPARPNSATEDWPTVAAQFTSAKVDVDTGSFVRKKITDVLTNDEYVALVKANTSHKKNIALDENFVVGVPLPTQGRLDAVRYKTALRQFVTVDFWDKLRLPMQELLSKNIRKEHPSGFVVCNFITHKPVNVQTAPPANTTVTAPNTGVIGGGASAGQGDAVVFINQRDPDKVYYVVAHEMGHNGWLYHFENAGGSTPAEHDQNDHNCLMSYSDPKGKLTHQAVGTFTPHFCGKCNLKLRGWDVTKKGMPAKSP
jgi:hypothetical protein